MVLVAYKLHSAMERERSRIRWVVSHATGRAHSKPVVRNKYPPAKPEVLRLLAPQRGLTAIATSKPKTEKTTNDGRLPELSNFESPPAEPGVYHD